MSGNHITAIQIATDTTEERLLQKQGFTRVDGHLDENSTATLWYKNDASSPITRIQFSFQGNMSTALIEAGYKQMKAILTGGKTITMWVMSATTQYDIAITDLKITNNLRDEISSYKGGWERLGCDLNRFGSGKPIYIWVKTEKQFYICEAGGSIEYVGETDLFKGGYICIDEDLNRGVESQGSAVFLFYRHSIKRENAFSDFQVSLSQTEETQYKTQGFTKLNYDLNDGTSADPVYLWYKKGGSNAVKNIYVLVGKEALDEYQNAGCTCINKNLNNGSNGTPLYIAYKA